MFIGKAARLSGTTVKSIRHYEAIGLLPTPTRIGKYRVYDQQTLQRLTCIKDAQQLGFKLKEMRTILDGPYEQARQAIATKKQELNEQIQQLQSMHDGLLAFEQRLIHALHTAQALPNTSEPCVPPAPKVLESIVSTGC